MPTATLQSQAFDSVSPAERVQRALAFIRQRPAQARTRAEVASMARCGTSYVTEFFRRNGAPTFLAVRCEARLTQAKQRLLAGECQKAIAADLGFANRHHFNATFKRWVGLPPGEWLIEELKRRSNAAAGVQS